MAIVPTESKFVGATSGDWQGELKAAIRDPFELCRVLDLPFEIAEQSLQATAAFSLFAPRPFVSRIEPGNVNDPLLRQLLPVPEECIEAPGYSVDPVGDRAAITTPGIVQKYPGRALIIATGSCAIHCRYCFRRHFPYREAPASLSDWRKSFHALHGDPTLSEVILSGGDPLNLNQLKLQQLVKLVEEIQHVQRIRIHTRLPIMIPSRVNDELVELLTTSRLVPYVVIHSNHSNEIDAQVVASISKLIDAGIPVLNQAVLLKQINDNVDALYDLSCKLIDNRILPYYLNLLDRVQGAAHFEVDRQRAIQLVEELATRLPGYAVPKLVADLGAEYAKTVIL